MSPETIKALSATPPPVESMPLKTAMEAAEQRSQSIRLENGNPIPVTYEELYPVLVELSRQPLPTNKEELKLHKERLEIVKKRFHAVQQSLPVIPTTSQQQADTHVMRHARAPGLRAARLKSLQAVAVRECVPTAGLEPYNLAGDPLVRLFKEPTILAAIYRSRMALVAAEIFAIENHDISYPDDTIKELDHMASETTDLAEARAIMEKISVLRHLVTSKTTSVVCRRQIDLKYQDAFKDLSALIALCKELLNDWRTRARELESGFAKQFEIASSPTRVSLRFDQALQKLPLVNRDTLAFFGVPDIAQ